MQGGIAPHLWMSFITCCMAASEVAHRLLVQGLTVAEVTTAIEQATIRTAERCLILEDEIACVFLLKSHVNHWNT